MKRGPKPIPTAELKLRGSRWANGRPDEPQAPPLSELPPCPDFVGEPGGEMWAELGPRLIARGVMTEWDLRAFAVACASWTRYVVMSGNEREAGVTMGPACRSLDSAFDKVLKMLREFGLTPSSRSQVKAVSESTDSQSAFEGLINLAH